MTDSDFFKTTSGDAEGIEIIWLHGWGQNHRAFTKTSDLLARQARHTLYDLPGFGQTPMMHAGADTRDYAEALAEQIQSGNRPKRIIIGHSFGCRVAVQLAAAHPGMADAYILISAAGLKRKRGLLWKLRAAGLRLLGRLAGICDALLGTQLKAAYGRRFGSADYRNAGDLRETFVAVVNEDLSEQAKQIKSPVTLVFGSEDTETPPELGERYKALIPDANLKILEGYGHLDILNRGAHQLQNIISGVIKRVQED